MRIQKLRFKNLNSLEGEWEIDFTNPSFINNGIFAIIGPTGAGKSTILDAICLALYAETPRLKRVNQSGNDIMSRKAASCFAEVQFVTSKGSYICHWSQKKARNKVDGKLQNPSHEIALVAEENTIIASTLVTVKEKVEEVTGMDFKRFTRSMLLAQGGFDVFLKADINERASILEQITGTDIYSKISVEVFLRRNQEREILNRLLGLVNTYQVLSQDECDELQARLLQLGAQETCLKKTIEETKVLISWKENLQRIDDEINECKTKLGILQKEINDFAPQRLRLDNARKTQSLLGEHSNVKALAKRLEELKSEFEGYQEKTNTLENLTNSLTLDLQRQQHLVNTAELQDTTNQQLYRQVRELDTLIQTQQGTLKTLQDEKRDLETKYQGIATEIRGLKANIHNTEQNLKTVQDYQEKYAQDAKLDGLLPLLLDQFQRLVDMEEELGKARIKLKAADSKSKLNELQNAIQQMEAMQNELSGIQNSKSELTASLTELLGEHDITHYRNNLQEISDYSNKLIDLQNLYNDHNSNQSAISTVHEQISTDNALITQLEGEITELYKELASTEQNLESKNAILALSQKIINLEEERKLLKDNEACPLCGALHHPYTDTGMPVPNILAEDLQELNLLYKKLQNEIRTMERKHTETSTRLLLQKQLLQDQETKDSLNQQSLVTLCAQLRLSIDKLSASVIENHISKSSSEKQKLAVIIAAEATLGKEIISLEQKQNQKKQSLSDLQQAKLGLEYDLQAITEEYNRCFESVNNLGDRIFAEKQSIVNNLSSQNVKLADLDEPEALVSKLKTAREHWKNYKDDETLLHTELNQQKSILLAKQSTAQEQLNQSASVVQNIAVMQAQIADKTSHRLQLFGDKDVQSEEQSWVTQLNKLKNTLNDLQIKHGTNTTALQGAKENMHKTEQQISKITKLLTHDMSAFSNALTQAGFSTLQDFEAAILPQKTLEELSRLDEQLKQQISGLQSLLDEKNTKLKTETAQQLTTSDLQELNSNSSILMEQMNQLSRESGTLEAQLKEDNRQKTAQAEHYRQINLQKSQLNRWEKLNDLIGSADGKKYRGFVQGITFEMLIAHANVQLQKLSDRYLLINNDSDPLELNIMDNYQGGEVRTIKNLSGGESFIVSLSLALGLSAMSSQRVRIDSLFLDEGFGSLDEDSLEIALENLAALNNEGKLIGIISHVPAIKERITNQIQVIPQTGGVSIITGIGCRYLSTAD